LVRAANEVGTLDALECHRLLNQALMTIRDLRRAIGARSSPAIADALADLQNTAAGLEKGRQTNEHIATALLDAAGIIRDLHIVLDTGTEIQMEQK
jgi:hypothetical protein